ncbi:MAG: DUF4440 domain-containing protein [Candidatus Aminicenantes bacterium]|nr:DUF4440 domain-containing protein [Candidatus Aminicenantes bacterium]
MKRSYFVIILVCLFCLGFLCCAPEKEELDMEQVRAAVEQANMKLGEAIRQGDAAAAASLYADDAILMPYETEMIKGKPGIEAYWNGAIQMGVKNLVLTVVELGGADDFVYEVGTAVMTVQLEGMTEPMEGGGKYVVIWKKGEDGTWKLHVDIFNTNAPAQ